MKRKAFKPDPAAPPLPPKGQRCDPKCKGWLHMNEPEEIQRCDECKRFPDDDQARAAHRVECGCDWPEVAPREAPLQRRSIVGAR